MQKKNFVPTFSGLDELHRLTGDNRCRLRVELGAWDGTSAYSQYRCREASIIACE